MLYATGSLACKEYESTEKCRFVFGQPGDDDYNEDKDADTIMEMEQMWVIDLEV